MTRIDTRKGDRHKPTEARKKNRNRPGYKPPPKPKKPKPPWEGTFQSLDGEGWNGMYTLLATSALPYDAYSKKGLTTDICLRYLTSWGIGGKNALVGFGLSYDFENILRDIPEEDYIRLVKDGQTIVYHKYELKYIPRKILEIKKPIPPKKGSTKSRYKAVYIQDTLGFFQSNFETALKKWELEAPPIIAEGKALRGDFRNQDPEWIKEYNREELRLLNEMMEKVRQADHDAFTAIGLNPNHGPRIWYGPGARAKEFLKQTLWVEEHPTFSGPVLDQLRQDLFPIKKEEDFNDGDKTLWEHPFAAAFFGGRIEAAALGEFKEPLSDFDLNSAYPWAISHLPKWESEDLIRVEGLDPLERMGMYHVEWNCPDGYTFYPFPYRSQSKNVFFPPRGRGWYMSVEVHAALTVWGAECVKVGQGYVLSGTEGGGDGLKTLPEEKLCTTAKKTREAAAHRLIAKANKQPAEKTLKLILNSEYGKTIQQIGSHAFLNLFAASWITATCRGMIVRTVGKDDTQSTISIMTDGILSRKPLNVKLGPNLGEFELTTYDYAIQFMPGIYYLSDSTGKNKTVSKYRGMGKTFNPLEAKSILWEKYWEEKVANEDGKTETVKHGTLSVELNVFVSRNLAIHQPNKFQGHEYTFYPVMKEEDFTLKSKRLPGKKGFRLFKKEKHHFFDAKKADAGEVLVYGSKPYTLDLPVELAYDDADSFEEMLEGNRIQSIVESSEYLL